MSNYFILECYGPRDQDRAVLGDIVGAPDVNWNLGKKFDTPIPSPLEVHLDPEQPGILMPMFDRTVLLMCDEMVATLKAIGVDNLDTYPAVLIDDLEGKRHENYKAVNIIGLVAAADLGKSVYSTRGGPPLIDADFDKLVIDEAKTHGQSMFRLAECVSAKVVHKRVKEALEKKHPYLNFVPPEDWMG